MVAKKKKGQSTVEYVVLVTAVIAIILVFLAPNGPFRIAYNSTLHAATNGMTEMANRLATSRPATNVDAL